MIIDMLNASKGDSHGKKSCFLFYLGFLVFLGMYLKRERWIFLMYFMRRINISYNFLMERKKCRAHVWYNAWPKWKKCYHVARLSRELSWQRQLHMDTEYWRSKGQCDLLDSGLWCSKTVSTTTVRWLFKGKYKFMFTVYQLCYLES